MAAKKKTAVKKTAKKKTGGGSRRRAAKPTKDETVEVNNAEPGLAGAQSLLSGNGMPPIRDLSYHLKQIKGYQDAAKTASGRVTTAKKAAKEAGVDLHAIALAMGFQRAEALDIATTLRQLQALMKEEGMPVQMGLYEPRFGSIEEQAATEGWQAGIAGRSPDTTRWPEGAPGHKEYSRRWNDAQREIIEKGATGNSENDGED